MGRWAVTCRCWPNSPTGEARVPAVTFDVTASKGGASSAFQFGPEKRSGGKGPGMSEKVRATDIRVQREYTQYKGWSLVFGPCTMRHPTSLGSNAV